MPPVVGDLDIVNNQAKLGVCRFAVMAGESIRITPICEYFTPLFDLDTYLSLEDCKCNLEIYKLCLRNLEKT